MIINPLPTFKEVPDRATKAANTESNSEILKNSSRARLSVLIFTSHYFSFQIVALIYLMVINKLIEI